MKNTLSITSDCVCTCVDSIADGTNRIFVALNVGNAKAPRLKIWLNDELKQIINLTNNQLNTVTIGDELFVSNGVIKFQYLDANYNGKFFIISFPEKLEGNLAVKMKREYVYIAKYTVKNSGGGGEPYVLTPATNENLGGIIVGDNLTIEENGRLSATSNFTAEEKQKLAGIEAGANNYKLPIATKNVIGGVKIGNNLAITSAGKLSVTNTIALNYSTEEEIVGTWIDGKPIYQITFHNNGLPVTFPINLTDFNIDVLVYTDAACSNSEEYGNIKWNMSCASGIDGRQIYMEDNYLKTTGWYPRHYVTLRYTKTTD